MMFSNWSLLLQRNAIDFTFLFYILNIAYLLAWNLGFQVFHLLSWDPMGFSISPGSPVFIYLGLAEWLVGSYFPNQGSNLHPRQWKHGVLTTGPLRNSLGSLIFTVIAFSNCTYTEQNGPGRPTFVSPASAGVLPTPHLRHLGLCTVNKVLRLTQSLLWGMGSDNPSFFSWLFLRARFPMPPFFVG